MVITKPMKKESYEYESFKFNIINRFILTYHDAGLLQKPNRPGRCF